MRMASRLVGAVCLMGLLLGVGSSAQAAMVRFVSAGSFLGFDPSTPGFPTVPDLTFSPSVGVSLPAGTTPNPNGVQYRLDHCLLVQGSSACQAGVPVGTPYTDRVTLTLEAAPTLDPLPAAGLYILIGGMESTGYSATDVFFETDDPQDPSVDPLLYLLLTAGGNDYHYFGFMFTSLGESRTVSYDVDAMAASGTPRILTSAYSPIPEPGTGILLGMGLVALGVGRRR